MLKPSFSKDLTEAGCDEAGRGCLAGPVYAAAVILPKDYDQPLLNDSKKISAKLREKLRVIIERDAIAWAVASVDNQIIDEINILNASILAMHRALDALSEKPALILVDGNRFKPYPGIGHNCIIKGDGIYMSIAAASILAKTYRDEFMQGLDFSFPQYGWKLNKGYPTMIHRKAISRYGITVYHRRSFRLGEQLKLFQG
jgi:ribonuclease HII